MSVNKAAKRTKPHEENMPQDVTLKKTAAVATPVASTNKTNAETPTNLPAVVDDGFDDTDEGSARIIRGTILSCVDGVWAAKDGTEFPPETAFVAMATAQALQRWREEAVVEVIRKIPGQPLPDVGALNAEIPKDDWEEGLNGPRPPWQHAFIVYLLNPVDASIFTVINTTTGMRICYDRLTERVKWMRSLRGSKVFPLVRLDKKPMQTQFGTKQRPELTILSWRDFSPQSAPAIEQQVKQAEQIGRPVTPVSTKEEMNDIIPF
jgi:hypothetical protein